MTADRVPLVVGDTAVMIRDGAAKFFAAKAPVAALRKLRKNGGGKEFSPLLWRDMADMGYAGVLVPDAHGGACLGYVAAGQIQEAIGRNLSVSPFLTTAVMAATAIMRAGAEDQRVKHLSAIAAGDSIITLAIDEQPRHAPQAVATRLRRSGSEHVLSGAKRFVADAAAADWLIVSARDEDRVDGIVLAFVNRQAEGVTVRRRATLDSRGAADVEFRDVRVTASDLLIGGSGPQDALDRALDAGRALLAAELLGIAEQSFAMTLAYLKQREQFGAKIGTFQALQHRAGRMFCEIELVRSAVLRALTALDTDEDNVPSMVSLAKAKAAAVAKLVTNEAMQMHGGIAMTDEFDIGLYLKRGQAAREWLGNEAFHRDRLATLLGY